jgi:hypothetical protein
VANGWLRFNYLLAARQFRTSSETRSSFNRWTLDLRHDIPLCRTAVSTGPRDFNGPNECGQELGAPACPPVSWSRNRQGAIGLRLLVTASTASDDNRVPFGVFVQGEQGKVTSDRGDLNFRNLMSSTTVGLTLRAGGFPMVNLSFSWGGEGHHVIGAMNTTLLGGSSRPSLF